MSKRAQIRVVGQRLPILGGNIREPMSAQWGSSGSAQASKPTRNSHIPPVITSVTEIRTLRPRSSAILLPVPKVFISYRHVPRDETLANQLASFLAANQFEVFIDKKLLTGQKWVEEIEHQIRTSQHFVALLSADSKIGRAHV